MTRLMLVAALLLSTAPSAVAQTVYIARHAEKAGGGADPALSEAGEARAQALEELMRGEPLSLVLTSPLLRTRQTAAPSAEARSAPVEAIGLENGAADHVAATAARVHSLPQDAAVLIVGHSNTVPLIARALGYADAADMPECEYDRLMVLKLDGQEVAGSTQRYGAASAC